MPINVVALSAGAIRIFSPSPAFTRSGRAASTFSNDGSAEEGDFDCDVAVENDEPTGDDVLFALAERYLFMARALFRSVSTGSISCTDALYRKMPFPVLDTFSILSCVSPPSIRRVKDEGDAVISGARISNVAGKENVGVFGSVLLTRMFAAWEPPPTSPAELNVTSTSVVSPG